jgi:hypothetical protein
MRDWHAEIRMSLPSQDYRRPPPVRASAWKLWPARRSGDGQDLRGAPPPRGRPDRKSPHPPLGDGGPDTKLNRIGLCANAHGAVHFLLDRARKVGGYGNVPWSYRRRFGPAVRQLAERGWAAIAAGRDGSAPLSGPSASDPLS